MNNNIKFASIAFLMLSAGLLPVSAKSISADKAIEIARNFRQGSSSARSVISAEPLKVDFSFKCEDGNDALYVVSAQEGFVIVAADDIFYPVIGYSDSGSFNYLELPSNVKWWFDQYAAQVQHYRQNGTSRVKSNGVKPRFTKAAERSNIEPIMKTRWDQDDPFNRLCPRIGNERCATGCVATAVAQVMKVYQWPVKSTGTATFENQKISFDTTYEWDQMLDYYGYGNYTSKQANAVAQLMWDIGRSVDMEYGWESGAWTNDVIGALYNNFGYDKSVKYSLRAYYDDDVWEQMMWEDLNVGHPIIYGGNSDEGGHQFVLDGYRDGYFHVNWGWSGAYDGYFLLDMLDPEGVGIGGGSGSFDDDQDAIYNIKKDEGGHIQIELSATGSFIFSRTSGNIDNFTASSSAISEWIGGTGFINFTGNDFEKARVGVKLVDMANPDNVIYCLDPSTYNYEQWATIVRYIQAEVRNVPDGNYRVYGVISVDDTGWHPVMVPAGCNQFITLNVNNGKKTYSNDPVDYVEVTSLTLNPTAIEIEEGETASIAATVSPANATNPALQWSSSNPEVATVAGGVVRAVAPGKCDIAASTVDGSQISQIVTVTVNEKNGVEGIMEDNVVSDVFDIQGRKILSGVTEDKVKTLERGIYIFAGRKIVVK